jgi:hypothetical protein
MYKTMTILKLAAASKDDQLNSMANSIDIPVKSKQPPRGLYTKTELGKDQIRVPADMHKVAAVSQRTGLSMFSKSSKQSSMSSPGGKTKQSKVTDDNMQEQLDASQYKNSIDRKDFAHQGFFGASESKRAPGLGAMLKS